MKNIFNKIIKFIKTKFYSSLAASHKKDGRLDTTSMLENKEKENKTTLVNLGFRDENNNII